MILKKIELTNFRLFKNASVDFSTDKDENMTVILGDNGYGKTTLVRAFVWCLYHENLFDTKILLNKDIQDKLPVGRAASSTVTISLEHDSRSYNISTEEVYVKAPNGSISAQTQAHTTVLYKDKDSGNWNTVNPKQVESVIDSILNPELREYFFYDGEKNNITDITKKKNLTEAVKDIMSLRMYEDLSDIYGKVITNLSNQIDGTNPVSQVDLTQKRDDLLKQIRSYEETIDKNKAEISRLEADQEDLESTISANKDVEQYQSRKREIADALPSLRDKKDELYKQMTQSFDKNFIYVLFAASFKNNHIEETVDSSTFQSGNSYVNITEEAVDYLINKGECLCGAKIQDGNDAYRHLIAAKEHMEPNDYGGYASNFIQCEENGQHYVNQQIDTIISSAEAEKEKIIDIDSKTKELHDLENKLAGRTDVGQLQSQIKKLDRDIGAKNYESQEKTNNCVKLNEKVSEINDQLLKNAENTKKNRIIQKSAEYAKCIQQLAKDCVSASSKTARENLEAKVNTIFQRIYHGEKKVLINNDFNAAVYELDDSKLDTSAGTLTVMNYAFVSGLIDLAKNKNVSGSKLPQDTRDSDYPLVMDAPFSNTDATHIKNICKVLPEFCDQIIMVVMAKDFENAEPVIAHKVGKKYELVKKSECDTDIKEIG